MNLTLEKNLRPCLVEQQDRTRRALVHEVFVEVFAHGASPLIGGFAAGQVSRAMVCVEYEDGSLDVVYPQMVRMLDSPFDEYCCEDERPLDSESNCGSGNQGEGGVNAY